MAQTTSKMRSHPRKRRMSARGNANCKAAPAAKRDVCNIKPLVEIEPSLRNDIAVACHLTLAACLAHSYAEPALIRPQGHRSLRLDEIRLRRVLNYIAKNLDQNITVAELAGVACLSPSHFASTFSATMGVAPHRYVSLQRLESAKMMLADGKRSLCDIAFSCQFSSQTSFNRAFLRVTGMTPGEYRRARVEERYLPPQLAGSKVQRAA
jgi:AraC-like DNA-binding protein